MLARVVVKLGGITAEDALNHPADRFQLKTGISRFYEIF